VDVHDVAKVLGLDKRIGPKFLHPGLGFGGSCLPKDGRALLAMAKGAGIKFGTVEGAFFTNEAICRYLLERLKSATGPLEGRTVGALGLAYKPFTDDVRESKALAFVRLLLEEGALVQAHDPAANESAATALQHEKVRLCGSAYEAAQDAEALLVLTEWNEFRSLDLTKLRQAMKGNVLLDARNVLDPDAVLSAGFVYLGRGRGPKTTELTEGVFAPVRR
jgi:UDPglucose 6-dehydrogenase